MLDMLWGLKTVAVFDVWSIEHVLSGMSIGSTVKKRNAKAMKKIFGHDITQQIVRFDIMGVLFLAFLWETIEHYLETGLAGEAATYWFQGVEFWPNRLIADPLLLVVGYYLAKKFPNYILPARILSVTWLLIHVFVLPHSMYLQELIGKL